MKAAIRAGAGILPEEELRNALRDHIFGAAIYSYRTIDSTSNRAKALAEQGAQEGTLVISEEQIAGRGRMGRDWVSPAGTGIWASLILRPPLSPIQVPLITLLAAVAVAGTIRRVTGLPAGIKWPNDIIINGKKTAGILTELSAGEKIVRYVVVGFGINVNTVTFPEEIRDRATSLRLCSGQEIPREEILIPLLHTMERLYFSAIQSGDFSDVLNRYREISVTIGKRVSVVRDDKEFTALALDITPTGGLLIKKDAGILEEIISDEVHLSCPKKHI